MWASSTTSREGFSHFGLTSKTGEDGESGALCARLDSGYLHWYCPALHPTVGSANLKDHATMMTRDSCDCTRAAMCPKSIGSFQNNDRCEVR